MSHAILQYFWKCMPRDTEVSKILRIENRSLFVPYKAYREMLSNSCTEYPEMWLWHDTSSNYEKLSEEGFATAHSSLEDNFYGAGTYFTVDPRLAAYFQSSSRGDADATRSASGVQSVQVC